MIHIINRHCNFSQVSVNKTRPSWFSREKCFINLIKTFQNKGIKLHVIFDGDISSHFVDKYGSSIDSIRVVKAGKETIAFKEAIKYATEISSNDNDILYFVEDDYVHRSNSSLILEEGFDIFKNNACISLYDHADKYNQEMYNNLSSQIFAGKLSHWRTTPSTTNTFAITKYNLNKYFDQFTLFSPDKLPCSLDHNRHLQLWKLGLPTVTSIPGYSTHCAPDYLSPVIDWEKEL